MKNIFIITISLIFAISCQSIGEDIVEIPLSEQKIVSTKVIELKKDDKVTIWTKCDVEFAKPDYSVKYSIEESNEIVEFDSLSYPVNEPQKIIRSSATREEVVEKNYDEKDTIIMKENYLFEQKSKDFIVPKNGKYTFDFKLTKTPKSRSSFSNNFIVILRK